MFSLRFSGSKFLINLRRQFHVSKICVRVRKIFRIQDFAGFAVFILFKIIISKVHNSWSRLLFHKNLLISRLLTSVFVLVNGIVFERSNGLIIEYLIACLMN